MNRSSIFSTLHNAAPTRAALLITATFALGACAPLPQGADNAQPASAPSASVAKAAPPAQPVRTAPATPPGVQRVKVGASGGYQVTVTATPPSQVCDADAFDDGVRFGYAQTWNRLVGDLARESGGKTSLRKFDAAALRAPDDQYKIQWNGKERVNACASDGYLIGRIVGTHLAGEDVRNGKSS